MPSSKGWIWESSIRELPYSTVIFLQIRWKDRDVVLNRRPDAAERLIELAEALKETMGGTSGQAAVKQDAWRENPYKSV